MTRPVGETTVEADLGPATILDAAHRSGFVLHGWAEAGEMTRDIFRDAYTRAVRAEQLVPAAEVERLREMLDYQTKRADEWHAIVLADTQRIFRLEAGVEAAQQWVGEQEVYSSETSRLAAILDAALGGRSASETPCATCNDDPNYGERAATPEEVDAGCEFGIAFDPCPACGGPQAASASETPEGPR